MKKQIIFDMAAFLGSLIFWSWLYMALYALFLCLRSRRLLQESARVEPADTSFYHPDSDSY